MNPVVIDTSAFVDAFVQPDGIGGGVLDVLPQFTEWFVPEGFELEVAHALRGIVLRGVLDWRDYSTQLALLMDLDVHKIPVSLLLPRVAQLGQTVGAFDAAFVALAEVLRAPLLTTDARLTRAPGPRCEFLLVEAN
jgi:predicted nucleic acid-binding protein